MACYLYMHTFFKQCLDEKKRGQLTLDNVEDGDVAVISEVGALCGSRDHHVLGLKKTTHHITYSCTSNLRYLFLRRQGRVARHEEMKPWCRCQWRN